jgi:glutamate-1-semialdehyde aminotransferase
MEPICINGGGILPKPGYLERVRELCDHHHITLIFDEVITGFRTALGGAQSLLGVTPDITVFGKALAGGVLPVSAIVGKKEVMQLYTDQRVIHAGTFNGYPLGLAGILATIELLENEPNAYERMGNILLKIGQSLVDAAKAVDIPMVVQGIPNILVFHSQSEPLIQPEGYDDDTKLRDILITRLCKEYGIQFSPIFRIYSNLLMEESDVEFFQSRIGEAMNEVKKITSLFESK